MAGNNFSVKATFDGQELVQGFKDVKSELNGLKTAGDNAGKSLGQMLQQKNSTSNYSRQLGQIKQQLTDLAVNYSRLSDAEKKSDFGVAMSARIDELTAKAQELKGVMDNVNSSLSDGSTGPKDYGEHWANLQRDAEQTYAKFEGVQKVSSGVASGFAAIQGAAALLGAENEDLQKALLKVQSAMAIAQGIGGIKDLFEGLKQLKAAFTFTTAATIADTAAKGANTAATTTYTAATTAATVAQKAFNTVAKANPYVLLASVILAVGVALVGFVNKTKDAKNAQEDFNNEITKLANQSSAEKIIRVKELSLAYASLGDNLNAKKQFVTDYKDELANMGIEMNNVNDADKIFVQQTSAYISALQARAKADATRQFASKKYNEYLETISEKEEQLQDIFSTIVESPQNEWGYMLSMDKLDLMDWDAISREYGVLPAIAKGFKTYRREIASLKREANTVVDDILADAIALDNKANTLLKKSGNGGTSGSTSGGSTTTKPDIFAEDSLRAAQQEVQTLQDKLNRMSPNDAAFETTKKQLIEAQARVNELQDKMKAPDDIINPASLNGLQQEVSTLQNRLNEMSPDDAAFDTTLQQLNEAKAKVKELQDKMCEPVTPLTETEQLVKAYDDASKQISDIVKQHEIGIIDEDEAKRQIDVINAELTNLGLKPIQIQLEVQTDAVMDAYSEIRRKIDDTLQKYDIGAIGPKQAQELINSFNSELEAIGLKPIEVNINAERAMQAIDGLAAHFEMLNAVGSAVSSINSIYEAFKSLPNAMDEAENGWERFMVGFNAGMQVLNAIVSIFGAINTLITTFNTIQAISTALKAKDAAASGAQAAASTAAATAAGTEAAANTAAAVSGAAKSVSWVPIVGAVLAVAAIAAVIGGIIAASNKAKFATGGIVPGNRIGDMDLVRVNGGEMILNGRQQSNLFRMLDQNRLPQFSGGSADVNFRIKGDTLIGVIDNYNKKHGRG